jgi:hypothetical protein
MSPIRCCVAPPPDAGTWSVVHWEGWLRKRYIVDAAQMRAEQGRTEFRGALCGQSPDPMFIVDDPREVSCEKCLGLLSSKMVQWHNALLARARSREKDGKRP